MLNTNLSVTIVLLIVTLFLLLFFVQKRAHKRNKKNYLQGIIWLNTFRQLLTSIQQHRGLTTGYINGDKSLLKRINNISQGINQQITAIKQQKGWIDNNHAWQGLEDHWSRLSVNYTKYETAHNLIQHGNLIVALLNLIEDCAHNHHLQELTITNNESADFLWSNLLTTAENIGQVRAIGTGIAAAKSVTSTQRIKLNYLQSCITTFLQTKKTDFNSEPLTGLLDTIEQEILTDKVQITAEHFFKISTTALDLLFKKFDTYVNDLKTAIERT